MKIFTLCLRTALAGVLVGVGHLTSLSYAETLPEAIMPEKHFEMLEKYCLDCHDADTEKGSVNLEYLNFDIAENLQTAGVWQKVLNSLNSGEMPPEDKKQLSAEEKTAFLDDLSSQIVVARKLLSDNGGEITLRRLNRREYANTLEELLGVRPDVSDLPDDQDTGGYDTLGASLFFSSDQLEQYLATARKTLELALFPRKNTESRTVRIEPEEKFTKVFQDRLAELEDRRDRTYAWRASNGKDAKEFGYLDGYMAERQLGSYENFYPQIKEYLERPETKTGATLILQIKGGMTRVELDTLSEREGGTFVARLRAAVYPDAAERFHYLEFVARDGQNSTRLGWRKVTGTLENPQIIEFPIEHRLGSKASYMVHQRTHQDRGDKNIWSSDRKVNGIGTPPGLWIDWAELTGPDQATVTNSVVAEVLFEKPEKMSADGYAREVIRRFAQRAFRGEEPSVEFLDKLFQQYKTNRDRGKKMLPALMEPLSIVLSAPSFLYMVESTGNEDSAALTGAELAVRLSYFLWSAPPDDELLSLAKSGDLSDPAVLEAQTNRLLADPRADRFVRSFVHQWLEMHRLDMFQFDGMRFRLFDNAARESAREEIFETVHTLLREKLPLRSLLKADFVVVNDILGAYYGLPNVEGHEFRKVTLPEGSARGGLLGMAAVHAMGSDGLRSSPVERGTWVLRHLLNTPPPPAPPNVPQLSRLDGEGFAARDLQKAHQEEPQCAQCHRKIDPIGYGLENFNAAGEWREMEQVVFTPAKGRKSQEKTFPIDPSGRFANGIEFKDYFELRDAILKQEDGFAGSLAEALIAYGLGRPYGFIDGALSEQMLAEAKKDDYEISAFVHALVQSIPFQTK